MKNLIQAFKPDWTEFQPTVALYGLPGLIGIFFIGWWLDQPLVALVAASGAFVVGFGAYQITFHDPRVPLVAVTVGVSVSAGVGTLANAWLPMETACTAIWGVGFGLMNLIAAGPGWLAMQGAIALVVAASFPATPHAAAERLLLVMAGGVVQLICVPALWSLAPGPFRRIRMRQQGAATVSGVLRHAWAIIARREPGLPVALTTGMAVAAAGMLAHRLPNGYWVGMTVLLVLRPEINETASRGLLRFVGTLLGGGLLTLLTAWLRPSPLLILAMIGFSAWLCYALVRVNYGLLSLSVTSYVVLLFALVGLPEPLVALHRTVATALGGVIALAAVLLTRAATVLFSRITPLRRHGTSQPRP